LKCDGLRGAVIPLFKKQIIEQGSIYFKMPIINLKNLAYVVIEETSEKYSLDISKIKIHTIIGLGSGEKVYEELMIEEERRMFIKNENLM
jgi:FlaA1/EpsC-like NDP-sugar epimerase